MLSSQGITRAEDVDVLGVDLSLLSLLSNMMFCFDHIADFVFPLYRVPLTVHRVRLLNIGTVRLVVLRA